jgi:hypothetical protein
MVHALGQILSLLFGLGPVLLEPVLAFPPTIMYDVFI